MSPRKKIAKAAEKAEAPMTAKPALGEIVEVDGVEEFDPEITETPIAEPAPERKPAMSTTRRTLFGRRPALQNVESLALDTGTKAGVLVALKLAYGWNHRTRISRSEFLRLRDKWLTQPASEV